MRQPPKKRPPETNGSVEAQPASAVRWPAPPFFRLPEPPSPARRDCALQLIDGRVTGGEPVELDIGTDSIGLRAAAATGLTRIAFAEIRSIKLTRPIAYVAETAALTALGAAESSTLRKRSKCRSATVQQ